MIDALLGYGLRGHPQARTAELIRWANASAAPVLALDTPSGLDVTTGQVGDPCLLADATLTLALPKLGLHRAPKHVGALFVADISVPPTVYRRFGLELTAPFAAGPILRIAGPTAEVP